MSRQLLPVVLVSLPTVPFRSPAALLLAAWVGGLTLSCASAQETRDPDRDAVCHRANSGTTVLGRCGRFTLGSVPIEAGLPDDNVLSAYREVIEEEVGAKLRVEDLERGFLWETPDNLPPRSGRALLVDEGGETRMLTCHVADAGKTATARCEQRLQQFQNEAERWPLVTEAELRTK